MTKVAQHISRILGSFTSISLIAITAVVIEGITARPSVSAETIRFHVIGPLTLSLSLDSLETLAVQLDGRKKPLDTVARETVAQIHGRCRI